MRGQFECDVIWLCFCFDFVRLYATYGAVVVPWFVGGGGSGRGKWGELKLDVQGQGAEEFWT